MDHSDTLGDSSSPAARFRPTRQLRQPVAQQGLNESTTAWEIYNDRARTVDKELIKDWNDSLNTLLIFAALYSAVLTAFIVESMKLLQEDSKDTARDILLVITRQLANSSVQAFELDPFVAPAYAVRVNVYFFSSISCNLAAALGAVLALQWVGSYDAGLNQSSPEERALQRHFRYQGVKQWKMDQIIAFLPVLIFLALFLFFIGLAEWMWTIHHGVAGMVMAGLVVGASFFLITTLLSMICVDAPFRTPASRSLPRFFAGLYYSLATLISTSPWRWITGVAETARRSTIGCLIRMKRLWDRRQALSIRSFYVSGLSSRPETFEVREQQQIQSIEDMGRTALLWLVNSVDVLPHTANHFQCVIRQMLLLPPGQIIDPCVEQAPWESIFSMLFNPYLQHPRSEPFSEREEEELVPILHAFSLVWSIPPRNKNFEWIMQRASRSANKMICIPAFFASRWQDKAMGLMDQSRLTLLADVVAQAGSLPSHILVALLLRLYQWQRTSMERETIELDPRVYLPINLHGDRAILVTDFAEVLSANLTGVTPSTNLPPNAMDVLFDILALRLLGAVPPGDTPLDRYSVSVGRVFREEQYVNNRKATEEIHNAVISQILGTLLQKDSFDAVKDDRTHLLQILYRLLRAKPLSITQTSCIRASLQVMLLDEPWSQTNRFQSAQIYALVLPEPYEFNGGDWWEWRAHFYLGLDKLLHRNEWASAASQKLIRKQAELEACADEQKTGLLACHIERLCIIRDPVLSIYASGGTRTPSIHPLSLPIAIGVSNQQDWEAALTWWSHSAIGWELEGFYFHSSHLPFINAIIPTWPQGIDRLARSLLFVQNVDGNAITAENWYSLLKRPALGALLRNWPSWDTNTRIFGIMQRVCTHAWFFEEFSEASGFTWLEETCSKSELEVTSIIGQSLINVASEGETIAWISCLYGYLARKPRHNGGGRELMELGKTSRGTRTPNRRTKRLASSRANHTDLLVNTLVDIYGEQQRYRTDNYVPSSHSNGSGTPDTTCKQRSTTKEGAYRHAYVRGWPDARWRTWQDTIEDILGGLRCGFIGLGPSHSTGRFIRDPDGLCPHL